MSELHADVDGQCLAADLNGDVDERRSASELHADVDEQCLAADLNGDVDEQCSVSVAHALAHGSAMFRRHISPIVGCYRGHRRAAFAHLNSQ